MKPRRQVTWWLIVALLVGMLGIGAALPWWWARSIERRVFATLAEKHQGQWAVLKMHIDGYPGRRLNLYATLWQQLVHELDSPGYGPYSNHHLAVLVSDNQYLYRYHWSLRRGELILNGTGKIAWIREEEQASYRFSSTELILEGVPCDRRAFRDGSDPFWYFPEQLPVESRRISPTPEAEIQPPLVE